MTMKVWIHLRIH